MSTELDAALIDAIDERVRAILAAERARRGYGVVQAVDTTAKTVSIYLSGEDTDVSEGFTYPAWITPAVGALVRVAFTAEGDRYVEEVYPTGGIASITAQQIGLGAAGAAADATIERPRAGVVGLPTYGKIATRASNLSIPTTTWTTVTYTGSEMTASAGITDTGGDHSVDIAGIYLVTGNVGFAANSTGRRILGVGVNGAENNRRKTSIMPNGSADYLSIATLLKLAAGDTASLRVWQNSGGALDLTDATFGLVRVGR